MLDNAPLLHKPVSGIQANVEDYMPCMDMSAGTCPACNAHGQLCEHRCWVELCTVVALYHICNDLKALVSQEMQQVQSIHGSGRNLNELTTLAPRLRMRQPRRVDSYLEPLRMVYYSLTASKGQSQYKKTAS